MYPRLIISTTVEAFRAFEKRYGDKLPEFSGDYTPYWEDGAASSALETALNRATGERLTQAETLWVMQHPGPFPAEAFNEAWRNVLLYSEHTWGAHNSITQPDLPFVRDQWKVKRAFALDADRQSRQLLDQAIAGDSTSPATTNAIDVLNTLSWERTDVAVLDALSLNRSDGYIVDDKGRPVPSQHLATGHLVFLARDVPPLGVKRFMLVQGRCPSQGAASATGESLCSADYQIKLDPKTGGIKSLMARKSGRELVSPTAPTGLNDFFYLPGADLKGLQRNGPVHVRIKESGPFVASLVIESEAPGCKRLIREVRLIDGVDRVELINTIDKLPIRQKEGLHFGYGFNVPNGSVRFDVGWAAVRPELDQIPASCKNWFSVQRWVDISNDKFGVTWAPLDAPLVELSDITANLIGSQTDWRVWIQHLGPSQTIYSWVMNNHWHTNYRADQEGPTTFRYAICAHGPFAADEAARFGQSYSQPLLAVPGRAGKPLPPRLQLSSSKVLVAGLKPAEDGHGWLIRLFGAAGKTERVNLTWSKPEPRQLWFSDTSEKALKPASRSIEVPAWGLVTLRAE
jgi:alpha-mannosidase